MLAQLLRSKHPHWRTGISSEQTGVLQDDPAKVPDILVTTSPSPIVIETEFFPARTVVPDAQTRLGKRLQSDGRRIEHAVACRLPTKLRSVTQSELLQELADSQISFKVISLLDNDQQEEWPKTEFCEGTVDDLADCIDLVGLSESLLARCADLLELAVSQVQGHMSQSSEHFGAVLCQDPGIQTNRMAAAIVANALMFHTTIENHPSVPTISSCRDAFGNLSCPSLVSAWRSIIEQVNYLPIFQIASNLLITLPADDAVQLLNKLYLHVESLKHLGAQRLNDLSGRVFQKLITDRKFLATFYTLPVSATLLSEIVAERLKIDWRDQEQVTRLRVADWACGTGTLIGAMYQSIRCRYRKHGDDQTIHAKMLENSLFAFDIMPAATHLAASTLASAHPGTAFSRTNVVTMPFGTVEGHTDPHLGSLDLLSDQSTRSLFSLGRQVLRGDADNEDLIDVADESSDIIIMNPPFTRPTNHERVTSDEGVPVPSFAAFGQSAEQQKLMARKLKSQLTKLNHYPMRASDGNAGLATNFIDLAHTKLATGGVLALVLPFTFIQGESWLRTRRLLDSLYHDILVVSIANYGSTKRAFSADTGMAEVLVVATKRQTQDKVEVENNVRYVNLTNRPKTQIESMMLARRIAKASGDSENEVQTHSLTTRGGYAAVRRAKSIGRCLDSVLQGIVALPRGQFVELPVAPLGQLGNRGLHVLDISGNPPQANRPPRGPFQHKPISNDVPMVEYPTLWGHDASAEKKIVVNADAECEVKPGSERHANNVWENYASRFHISVDFQLNSQPLVACMTNERTLGGRAWPNFVLDSDSWEKACALWFNSTLGIMSFWWIATRPQQGRASVTVSRHPSLPSIDPRRLSETQFTKLDQIFEEFSSKEFLPANEAYRDDTRVALDEELLCNVLNSDTRVLSDLEILRSQWCAEPSVHGGKKTRIQLKRAV